MKKKLAILGSTGSIGKNLLDILNKNKNKYDIVLLTANKNYSELLRNAKKYKVKNLIITDNKSYYTLKDKTKNLKINVYNNFDSFDKIFKQKIDYTMSAIVGLDGLYPTYKIIKHTKNIAIANKEAIICAWDIIKKELKKNSTKFIPVDSEHFSIWFNLESRSNAINKIFLTASGGPFLNLPFDKFKNAKLKDALNHPSWKMGKKISIDSATLMNKVFEVIEAKNIFDLDYKKIDILTHPISYVHAIVHYSNGMINLTAHETDMKIPIVNSLNLNKNFIYQNNLELDLSKINNLNLKKINHKKFPLARILKGLPKKNSLFETILVTANDEIVDQYLNKKINFHEIAKKLLKLLSKKEFVKYKNKIPRKIQDVLSLSNFVRFKIRSKSI